MSLENSSKLPDQVLLQCFSYLSSKELFKCATICKNWQNLAQQQSLWKRLLQLTYHKDILDKSLYQKISQGNDIQQSQEENKYEDKNSQNINWYSNLMKNPITSHWRFLRWTNYVSSQSLQYELRLEYKTKASQPPKKAQLISKKIIQFPQSQWISFTLQEEQVNQNFEILQVVFKDRRNQERIILQVEDLQWPQTEFDRLFMSHIEGVYIFGRIDQEFETTLDYLDLGAGHHIMIYMHFFHLYEALTPLYKIPVDIPLKIGQQQKMSFGTASGYPYSGRVLCKENLYLILDFASLLTGKLEASFLVLLKHFDPKKQRNKEPRRIYEERISDTQTIATLWINEEQIKPLQSHQNQTDSKTFKRLYPNQNQIEADHIPSTLIMDDVDLLNNLFQQELLCDFSIYDKKGQLLIGRSGVESWSQVNININEERSIEHTLSFIGDRQLQRQNYSANFQYDELIISYIQLQKGQYPNLTESFDLDIQLNLVIQSLGRFLQEE